MTAHKQTQKKAAEGNFSVSKNYIKSNPISVKFKK